MCGHAQDSSRRAVIIDQRPHKTRRCLGVGSGHAGKALQKYRKAAERRAAKPVNRLGVVPYGNDVALLPTQAPKQLDLCDVGVLELVHQDVPKTPAHTRRKSRVSIERAHCVQQLHTKCKQMAFAQQPVARPVSPRNLLLPANLFFAQPALVLGKRFALARIVLRKRRHVMFVIVRSD